MALSKKSDAIQKENLERVKPASDFPQLNKLEDKAKRMFDDLEDEEEENEQNFDANALMNVDAFNKKR